MTAEVSKRFFRAQVEELKSRGGYRELTRLEGANSAEVRIGGKRMINLCSNNYLGLADHPALKKAAAEAVEKYGAGASSARNIIGNNQLYEDLERLIAEFKNEEAAVISQSGYNCNLGAIPVIMGEGDIIFSDELNHASIIDGMRQCKAEKEIYGHMDMCSLEEALKENRGRGKKAMIVTDTVFSMDGEIAPLPDIVELAEKYEAMVYADDAHGTGVLGRGGRGAVDHFGLTGRVDFALGTLSKAIPTMGAYLSGSSEMRDWLVRNARPILFSTSIVPAALGAAIAAFHLLMESTAYVDRLWENTIYFKEKLREMGLSTGGSKTPIVPVILGGDEKAILFSRKLQEKGVLVSSIVFPVVPREKARVRCIVTAGHTQAQLDECLNAFEKTGREMNII